MTFMAHFMFGLYISSGSPDKLWKAFLRQKIKTMEHGLPQKTDENSKIDKRNKKSVCIVSPYRYNPFTKRAKLRK